MDRLTTFCHLLSALPATISLGQTGPPCHHPEDKDKDRSPGRSSLERPCASMSSCRALCFSSVTCPHYPVIWPYLICSLTTSGHVTGFTWVLHFTRPSVSARLETRRHLTTIRTVTIAATPLLINFLTSQPGRGLNLDRLSILDDRKTQWR